MEQLKLLALDADDLEIVSAHVQDAVMQIGAFDWRPKEKRFLIEMNRFVWEKAGGTFRRHNERRRSVLHFDRVLAVRSAGIDRAKPQDVLSLLTIGFAEDDAPAGTIEIGVRPENLKVEPWSDGRAGRPATVFEVEPLGGYTVVTIDAGETRLRALMRGQPDIRPQSVVALGCDPARVHFFGQGGGALSR